MGPAWEGVAWIIDDRITSEATIVRRIEIEHEHLRVPGQAAYAHFQKRSLHR